MLVFFKMTLNCQIVVYVGYVLCSWCFTSIKFSGGGCNRVVNVHVNVYLIFIYNLYL